SVSDDGYPEPGALVQVWTKAAGPGVVTFGNSSTPETTVTFSSAGTYILRLTANDSQFSTFDEVTVTVLPANEPPFVEVSAESDFVMLPEAAFLHGFISD